MKLKTFFLLSACLTFILSAGCKSHKEMTSQSSSDLAMDISKQVQEALNRVVERQTVSSFTFDSILINIRRPVNRVESSALIDSWPIDSSDQATRNSLSHGNSSADFEDISIKAFNGKSSQLTDSKDSINALLNNSAHLLLYGHIDEETAATSDSSPSWLSPSFSGVVVWSLIIAAVILGIVYLFKRKLNP